MARVEKLCLGTVQFGLNYGINNTTGLLADTEIFEILDYAIKEGVAQLDTAEAYGGVIDIIGRYHRHSGKKFNINSKFSLSNRSLASMLEQSLMRLNVEKLNLYQFHDYHEFENNPAIQQQLVAVKKQDLVKQIGVSVYSNEELIKLSGYDFVDVIQFPFNLLDNHSQRQKAMQLCIERGKTLHARSVFLQGLFYKDFDEYPDKLRQLLPYTKKLIEISSEASIPMSQLALNYALQESNVDTVIIGVDSLAQLKENLDNSLKLIPPGVVDEINKIHVKEAQLLFPKNW
jgi:uncharacterized protein